MKSVYSLVSIAVAVLSCASVANAFAPQSGIATRKFVSRPTKTATMDFLGEQEKTSLTREDEPDEFFQTNTDKMTDKEKIPIAIAGIVFISLPFIGGLIALYSAK